MSFSQQGGTLNFLGNHNTVRITRSHLVLTVNGNHNTFLIHATDATLTLNGNHNHVKATQAILTYDFNGNHNHIQTDENTTHRVLYCNGMGNIFPGASRNGSQRTNSGNCRENYSQANTFPQQNSFRPYHSDQQ